MLSLIFNPPQDLIPRTRIRDRPEHILPRLADVGVYRAKGLEEPEDLLAVLDALQGVDERYMPLVPLVGVEECGSAQPWCGG